MIMPCLRAPPPPSFDVGVYRCGNLILGPKKPLFIIFVEIAWAWTGLVRWSGLEVTGRTSASDGMLLQLLQRLQHAPQPLRSSSRDSRPVTIAQLLCF